MREEIEVRVRVVRAGKGGAVGVAHQVAPTWSRLAHSVVWSHGAHLGGPSARALVTLARHPCHPLPMSQDALRGCCCGGQQVNNIVHRGQQVCSTPRSAVRVVIAAPPDSSV
jgi:hypothetical protein